MCSIILTCRKRTYSAITYAFYSGLNEFNFELNTICQTRPAQITVDLVAEKVRPSVLPTLGVAKSKLIKYKQQYVAEAKNIKMWNLHQPMVQNALKMLYQSRYNNADQSLTEQLYSSRDQSQDAKAQTYYDVLNQQAAILFSQLSADGKVTRAFRQIDQLVEGFEPYSDIYQANVAVCLEPFFHTKPTLSEYQTKIQYYNDIIAQINENFKDVVKLGIFSVNMVEVKQRIIQKANTFISCLLESLNQDCRNKVAAIKQVQQQMKQQMATPITSLDDIRSIMNALQRMREMQATFDDALDPISRAY